jgi:phosphatidylglycerol:prolipoprotein diacylglycerol transferase
MKTQILIETAHGGMYYSITYLAAILLAAGIAIYSGFRKGYPKISWLLILLAGGIGFIVGEKIFSYSSAQWWQVFTGFTFPSTDKKTILGGIIGLFAGLCLGRILLRFRLPVLDNFALGLPLAMAISRVGCLMAGCCYGTPSGLPWGIRYDAASPAYHSHLSHGLIGLGDKFSLTVHPVQLYQVIGCLIIALIVWKTRKHWNANGSLFLFSVLSYTFLRFLIEFVRDPDSSFVLVKMFFGLKAIQWIILAVMIAGSLVLIYREARGGEQNITIVPGNNHAWRRAFLMFLMWAAALTGKNWFTELEYFVILIFLLPITLTFSVSLYRRYTVAGFRWIIPMVLVGSFLLMSQTIIPEEKDDKKTRFTEIGFNTVLGKYNEIVESVKYSPSCESSNIYEPYGDQQKKFYQGEIDFSYNIWRDKYKFKIGTIAFYGQESGEIETDYPAGPTIGVHPYFNFDWKEIGLGGGFSIGKLKYLGNIEADKFSAGSKISADYRIWYLLPSFNLRIGPRQSLFAEASLPGHAPSVTPYNLYQIGIGSGLGKTNGTKVVIGYCHSGSSKEYKNGFYSELTCPIKKIYVLKAYYQDNFLACDNRIQTFSFGMNFRLFSKRDSSDENINQ